MPDRIRSSLICVHDGKILGFNAIDPQSGKKYFFLPGGEVEESESPLITAIRETKEETGYDVEAFPDSEIIYDYGFFWNGRHYDCRTYFYSGRLKGEFHEPRPVDDAPYNQGPEWKPLSEVDQLFDYTKEILKALKSLIGYKK